MLEEVLVRQDAVVLDAGLGRHREGAGVGLGGASGQHDGAAGDHEGPQHLLGVGVPEPVPDLGVERVDLVTAPSGHAVVEAVEALGAVVDGPEGAEGDPLAVGGLADLVVLVVEGDVEATGTLPGADEGGEGSELGEVVHGAGGYPGTVDAPDVGGLVGLISSRRPAA